MVRSSIRTREIRMIRNLRATKAALPSGSRQGRNRGRLAIRALLIGAALLASSALTPGFAEQTGVTAFGLSQAERAKVFAALPNWSGLWNPVGGLIFDPSTADPKGNNAQQPGDREHPPYNAEWEARYKARLEHTLAGYFTDPIGEC